LKLLRLSPDYFCSPLWDDGYCDPDEDPELKPESLGLSKKLCADLWDWAEVFDRTLNMESPVDSGFLTPEDERAFDQRGMELARMIVSEMEGHASVRYRHGNTIVVISGA
jgi:hypothetical protein